MHDFLQMVLNLLREGIGFAVVVVGLSVILLLVIFFLYKVKTKEDKKFPWRKAITILLLVGYIAVLIYATLLRMGGVGFRDANFHLFRAWREAWNNYSLQNWLNVLLNVALFVPLGFLLPYIKSCFQKWYVMLITGFSTSLCIEIVQYFTGRGLFDVDDLFTNTVGAMLGYCMIQFIMYLTKKDNRKKSIPYAIYMITFTTMIIGIFVKYELQEYGNLPEAPTMTADVKGIEWNLECELDMEEKLVPTYSIVPYSKEDCDAFGAEFAQKMSISFTDTYYYDNSTIFANHSTGDFLYVYFFDHSYEYNVGDVDIMLDDIEVDEVTMRKLLEPYDITIPETAEFAYEGNGCHTFYVSMEEVGDSLIDGTISCRVKKGNLLEQLNNKLATYTLYSDVEIISEEAAYKQLCSGKFYGSDGIEYYKPDIITVLSCRLEYRIDTKGFYQPVYIFEIDMQGEDIREIVIPAMK